MQQASECFDQAVRLFRSINMKADEAMLNWQVGALYGQQGDTARAIELMQRAVDLFNAIDHPDAHTCAAYLMHIRTSLDAQ